MCTNNAHAQASGCILGCVGIIYKKYGQNLDKDTTARGTIIFPIVTFPGKLRRLCKDLRNSLVLLRGRLEILSSDLFSHLFSLSIRYRSLKTNDIWFLSPFISSHLIYSRQLLDGCGIILQVCLQPNKQFLAQMVNSHKKGLLNLPEHFWACLASSLPPRRFLH